MLIDWREVAAMHSFTTLSGDKVELFAAYAALREAISVEMMRVAVDLFERAGQDTAESIGDELAAAANWHPETGRTFTKTSVLIAAIPHVWEAMERGELTERHAKVALEVLPASLPDAVREAVTRTVLHRMRERAGQGNGWPTPGRFRQLLRNARPRLRAAAAEYQPGLAVRCRSAATDLRRCHLRGGAGRRRRCARSRSQASRGLRSGPTT